jgi:hypothetical protein
VLGTPPAFNLSQDQTLHLKTLSFKRQSIQKPNDCWTSGHSVFASHGIDASPHTNYLPNF